MPARGWIGVDDIEPPYWATVDRTVVSASTAAMVRAVPRMVALSARRAWQSAPGLTALAVVLQLLSGAVTAFGLLATANVFTQLLTTGPTPERMVAALPAIALVATAYAAGGLLDAATDLTQSTLGPRVERRIQDEFYTAVIDVELVAFDDPDYVELINRASGSAIANLRRAVDTSGDLLAALVSVAAAMITAGVLHPALAPVVFLPVLPQAWATIRSSKISYQSFLDPTSRIRRMGGTSGLITSRADADEVRAFTVQELLLDEHRRIAADLTGEVITLARRTTTVRLIGRTLAGVGSAAAYVVLGLLIYAQAIPLALAGAAALALSTATRSVSTAVRSANSLYENSLYLDLHQRALADTLARTRRAPAARAVPAPSTIELDGVGFTYPGQERPALDGISLALRAGQTVALVGENGSGKSTLARLLSGLYLPDRGTVSWDGTDIACLDPRAMHQHVAVVMQHPTQWPMTAADNIRIGRSTAADPGHERLGRAAAQSGADAVIDELPNGPDTMLSRWFQTGRDLSGGQWQRISVARGLYRDAPLVIADEPTAAMDARAEHAVFGHLRGLATTKGAAAHGARITVLITHRLANVRHADHIVVLDRGRLTAQGTHDQLMAAGGTYADLFTLQASAYTGAP